MHRYSLFVILYPVGIGSEWWLMYNATKVTGNMAVLAVFYFFLGLYVPGKLRSTTLSTQSLEEKREF
jgi:very-long-chain (3R)-3-hydroxyacyl-CoA dehydratase